MVDKIEAHDTTHFKGVDEETEQPTESLVCVPLRAGGRTIGVMQLLNKRDGNYTERDKVLLERFADQAAVAIRNATLFENVLAHMGLYTRHQGRAGPAGLVRELNQPARNELLTVMFADMRGFTQLCQISHDPALTQQRLDEFFTMICDEGSATTAS